MTGDEGFTAVVLAADRQANDPVAVAAGSPCKSLAPVADRPMLLRVLDTLEASSEIDTSVLCGPEWALVEQYRELLERVNHSPRLRWVQPQATPSQSARFAVKDIPPTAPVLLTTADHALLTPRIVDFFCGHARAANYDVIVGLAPRALVEQAFPGMRRTAYRLSDEAYCGCNLFAFLTPTGRNITTLWQKIEQQRKKPWRVIHLLGWFLVLRYLTGRLSLQQALDRLSRKTGLRVGAVILPFPEAAVDVDSPADLEAVRQYAMRAHAGSKA